MKEYIEFVCGANHGRSPIAEAVAREYLSTKYRAEKTYGVRSSGTLVNQVLQWEVGRKFPDAIAKACIEMGKSKGILPLTVGEIDQSEAFRAFQVFEQEEAEFREKAALKFNLGKLKGIRDQCVPMQDSAYILGMKKENTNAVREIYTREPGFHPIIETLKGFAFMKEGLDFSAAYGKDFDAYCKMVEEIRDYTRKAIDNVFALDEEVKRRKISGAMENLL